MVFMTRLLAATVPGTLFIALLLGFVEFATRTGMVNAALVPRPTETALALWKIIVSGDVVGPTVETLMLLFLGYAIACLAGILIGILMGHFEPVYCLLEPLSEILRTIPKPVLLPPLMLFLGLGLPMKIFIVALATFFPVLINTVQAVRGIDPVLIDTARTFGHSKLAILWRVVLPSSSLLILAGMRVGLGIGLVLVILSEMMAGTGGLGQAIGDAQNVFKVRETFAWLVVIAVIGFALAMLFDWVERRVTFWDRSGRE